MSQLMCARTSWHASLRFALAATVAAVAALSLPPASATTSSHSSSPTTCTVRNRATSTTYSDLQNAVDAASAGDTLRVRGTCSAPIVVSKNLTLSGRDEDRNAIIQGSNLVTPLTVTQDATVVVRDITLRDGGGVYPYSNHFIGGGIYNAGTLTLEGSTLVTNNTAHYGAGIFNTGILRLAGRTRITNNHGSGIDNYWGGAVTVTDHVVISGNDWNGVVNTKGTSDGSGSASLSLRGSARVTGNGGFGILNDCLSTLTIGRHVHVTGNLSGNVSTWGSATFCEGYITA